MAEEKNATADVEKNTHRQHHLDCQTPKRGNKSLICTVVTILLVAVGIVSLILWLLYRPSKPHFAVITAAIYSLNLSPPPSNSSQYITTTMQFTIMMKNPNKRTSIQYKNLKAFVVYKHQAVTPPLMLPPLFHEKRSSVVMSPVIGGSPVYLPIPMDVVNGFAVDQQYGAVGLRVLITGRLRWVFVGGVKSRYRGVKVDCNVIVAFKKGGYGNLPLLSTPGCNVDV